MFNALLNKTFVLNQLFSSAKSHYWEYFAILNQVGHIIGKKLIQSTRQLLPYIAVMESGVVCLSHTGVKISYAITIALSGTAKINNDLCFVNLKSTYRSAFKLC